MAIGQGFHGGSTVVHVAAKENRPQLYIGQKRWQQRADRIRKASCSPWRAIIACTFVALEVAQGKRFAEF